MTELMGARTPPWESFNRGAVMPVLSILTICEPPAENATVSAAGKNRPVLVSVEGVIAGAAAVPALEKVMLFVLTTTVIFLSSY
jgi:hypothetical protein